MKRLRTSRDILLVLVLVSACGDSQAFDVDSPGGASSAVNVVIGEGDGLVPVPEGAIAPVGDFMSGFKFGEATDRDEDAVEARQSAARNAAIAALSSRVSRNRRLHDFIVTEVVAGEMTRVSGVGAAGEVVLHHGALSLDCGYPLRFREGGRYAALTDPTGIIATADDVVALGEPQ